MADTLDIVDLTTAQKAIGVPDDSLPLLASYITVVSRHIDGLCGPVVQRTITAEAHHGGLANILLRYRPVISVTSVTEWAVTLSATDYHLDAESGILERVYSSFWPRPFIYGRWNIIVTYVAGRYATTALVDPVFAQAAVMAVQGLWQSEQAMGGNQTFGAASDGLDINSAVPGGTQYVLPKAAWMLLHGVGAIASKAGIA